MFVPLLSLALLPSLLRPSRLRFVLDNGVDVEICRLLRGRRHECWTVAVAGLAAAEDVMCLSTRTIKGAVLTYEREFTRRRKEHTPSGDTSAWPAIIRRPPLFRHAC